jgi:chitin disaccharide deacetylase
MKKIYLLTALSLIIAYLPAQTKTLAEKLGYSKNTKLLIIHADDLGVAHSENAASVNAMENGSINSASIMVPCPWFPEIAAYANLRRSADLGLHLTLTSEWKYYKWGPVAGVNEVPSLVNQQGYFYSSVDSLYKTGTAVEVAKELKAQIEKAKATGIDITHLDSHMGSAFANEAYLKVLIELGREYKLPVMLSKLVMQMGFNVNIDNMTTEKDVIIDMIYTAQPGDYKKGMNQYYTSVLNTLKPGVSVILLHAAYDDSEMKAITVDHSEWGAAWRQADYNFFRSATCKNLLQKNNIKLITWRELRDKLLR